ncbi:sulfite exporter TauE/SafE family protein [Stenotrophomonas sp. MMGLT7]|uniref:sulfite exporter TauE/SafE family protein n=1 Tax=Stenotrophomonas sp. MMGLT7 TaxID=2901227 RepID=UPI001E48165C|nr:sulfite exporter TauE/SafE family protein [Stenotrophomonas sp. MMGLT7]MCD7096864.1 sulfite exporter TauE/SafE family protein [Stenotrophomonas sp. MMGLT7]
MQTSGYGIWAACAAIFVVAGVVKGVTGMGLPTVAIALMAGLLPTPLAAALLVVPTLVTNLRQATGAGVMPLLRRLWPMLLLTACGTLLTAPLLAGSGQGISSGWLGLVLLVYALQGLRRHPWQVPAAAERWLSPLVGVLTGVAGGATGVFIVPSVPYLQALGLERDALVQALALSFTVSAVAMGTVLAGHGAMGTGTAAASALLVLPAMAGMYVGNRIRERISAVAFKRGFLLCLVLLGAELVWRAWG